MKQSAFSSILGAALICGALAVSPAVHADNVVSKAKAVAHLALKSSSALVLDQFSGEVLYGKNASAVLPIASISKLMTAMVVLDGHLDPNEAIR